MEIQGGQQGSSRRKYREQCDGSRERSCTRPPQIPAAVAGVVSHPARGLHWHSLQETSKGISWFLVVILILPLDSRLLPAPS